MKFVDLRVKTKLMLGFACVAAIVLLVSALSLHSLGASNDAARAGEQGRRMTDLMGEINASSGIVQVNTAVAAIDRGTQQNAALVEESAAAAESLKLQAAGLLNLVAAFKTADTHGAAFA